MSDPIGVLLSDDLIFTSRITATARSLDLTVRSAGSVDALVKSAKDHRATGVLIDLDFPGLHIEELIANLKAECAAMPRVLGYGSHVNVERLKAAREAGCDPVLPRSAFVEKLPEDLPTWLGAE